MNARTKEDIERHIAEITFVAKAVCNLNYDDPNGPLTRLLSTRGSIELGRGRRPKIVACGTDEKSLRKLVPRGVSLSCDLPIYEELTKIREVLFDDESDPCAAWVEFEGRHLPPQAARHYACREKRYQARRRHVTLFTNSGRLTQHHDAEQMDADSYIENACTQKQNKRRRRRTCSRSIF